MRRGLSFRKVFIPGLVSGSFPQPVRPLPLLSSSERRMVLGGTIESQFAFARHLYANFLAAAPQIALSRPAISKDGEICIPSPFWTEEGERKIDAVIPWKHSLPAMQRARWVRQSISKITVSGSDRKCKGFLRTRSGPVPNTTAPDSQSDFSQRTAISAALPGPVFLPPCSWPGSA